MSFQKRTYDALLRSNFPAFVEKVFTHLNPGQQFVPSWHLDAIAYQLDRVRKGEIRRLIINMPPRSLKSIMASVALPAFILGRDPTRRLICTSYSGELAKKHSNDFRAVLSSVWYRDLFPATRISESKNTETEIETTMRGYRMAASVGGTLTGRGGDIIIVDDPLKADDALSETKRTAANEWFTSTLLTRLDDKQTGAIIVVMQRIHMDDLTGFLLAQGGEWELLSLPAIADQEEVIQVSESDFHRRHVGEVLSPDREPLRVLEDLKETIGADKFSAQYQQAPVPPGGAMIKRDWVKWYDELPSRDLCRVIQSWDTASKGGPDNDWSVCTTWYRRETFWYLAHVWRKRVDYPTLKDNVRSQAAYWRASRVLVEDAGTGTSLVQELRGEIGLSRFYNCRSNGLCAQDGSHVDP